MTPRGQYYALRARFRFPALCPLAPTPLELKTPNLVQGCSVIRSFEIEKFRGVQKLEGSKFWFFFKKNILIIKFSYRPAAQTESGRESNLSSQKDLGLTWVPYVESATWVQNYALRARFHFTALCPLAPTSVYRELPNLVQGCRLTRSINAENFRGVQKLGGSKFWFFEKKIFWSFLGELCQNTQIWVKKKIDAKNFEIFRNSSLRFWHRRRRVTSPASIKVIERNV